MARCRIEYVLGNLVDNFSEDPPESRVARVKKEFLEYGLDLPQLQGNVSQVRNSAENRKKKKRYLTKIWPKNDFGPKFSTKWQKLTTENIRSSILPRKSRNEIF